MLSEGMNALAGERSAELPPARQKSQQIWSYLVPRRRVVGASPLSEAVYGIASMPS